MFSPGSEAVHGSCIMFHSKHSNHVSEPVIHNVVLISSDFHRKAKRVLLVPAYFCQQAFALEVFKSAQRSSCIAFIYASRRYLTDRMW